MIWHALDIVRNLKMMKINTILTIIVIMILLSILMTINNNADSNNNEKPINSNPMLNATSRE